MPVIMGNPNAKVFPLPVSAAPRISLRPAKKIDENLFLTKITQYNNQIIYGKKRVPNIAGDSVSDCIFVGS